MESPSADSDKTKNVPSLEGIRPSEKWIRSFLENMGDIAYKADSLGNVTYANRAAVIITEVSLKEIVGKPFLSLFTAESQKLAIGEYQRALNGESSEYELTFNNGRTCHFKNNPLRNENGEIIGVYGTARDITNRKEVEEALRGRKERFRIIFENSPISLWEEDFSEVKKYIDNIRKSGIRDFRGYFEKNPNAVINCVQKVKVLAVNKSTLNMYQATNSKEFLDSLDKVFAEASYDLFKEGLIAISEGKKTFEGEGVNQTLRGEIKNINLKWSVSPGHEKTLSKVLVSIIDITERKQREAKLRRNLSELEKDANKSTIELKKTLKKLEQSKKELIKRKSIIEKVNRQLMETNKALTVLARNIDKDKQIFEKRIYKITNSKIIPIIKEIQEDIYCQRRRADLEIILEYLNDIFSGSTFRNEMDTSLSEQEMRVAIMIKNGLTSQKIANMLYISLNTVKTHRKNIRKKLNIHNSKVNLSSFMKSKIKNSG